MPHVVAFVPDLMDRSKFASYQALHSDLRFVSSMSQLLDEARSARLVVLDLGRSGILEALAEIQKIKRERNSEFRCIGFASHIEEGLMRAAKDAGCDEVLSRSAFFRALPGAMVAD